MPTALYYVKQTRDSLRSGRRPICDISLSSYLLPKCFLHSSSSLPPSFSIEFVSRLNRSSLRSTVPHSGVFSVGLRALGLSEYLEPRLSIPFSASFRSIFVASLDPFRILFCWSPNTSDCVRLAALGHRRSLVLRKKTFLTSAFS